MVISTEPWLQKKESDWLTTEDEKEILNQTKNSISSLTKYDNTELDVHEQADSNYFEYYQLISAELPPTEWIVQNLIPKKGITYIGGDSGVGKSLFVQDLTHSIEYRKPFLNFFELFEDITCLYIDEENRANVIKERMRAFTASYNNINNLTQSQWTNKTRFLIDVGITIDNLKDDRARLKWKYLLEKIEEIKPSLIIFDSFVRFFTGNENNSQEVRVVYEELKKLVIQHDLAIIMLQHTVKNPNGNMKHALRGSGDLSASADSVLMITKYGTSNKRQVTQVKNRHAQEEKPFNYEIVNLENIDGFYLNYCGDVEKDIKELEATVEEYKQILSTYSINSSFKTKNLVNLLPERSQTTKERAIKSLLEDGVFNKPVKGTYILKKLPFIEEELEC